ncbi:MAG TPA: hypothetical protein VG052_03120 [Puia sp.]|jgi:hypothetical protein|nr:hypothetical protein [Puia sp.]
MRKVLVNLLEAKDSKYHIDIEIDRLINSITNTISGDNMGYIKEPKGVDFVVEPHVLTDEDQKIMSKIIADFKATGKITKAPKPKRARRTTKKKAKR